MTISNFELFDFEYPTPNQQFKEDFEKLFFDFYYFEEIGQETPDRFKQRLKSKLNLIMPKYIKIYELEANAINPNLLEEVNETYQEASLINNDLNDDVTNTTNATNNDSVSETFTSYPQHSSIADDVPTSKSQREANNSQQTTSNQNQQQSKVEDRARDYERLTQRKGSYSQMLELRGQMKYIMLDILKELKPLFILVY